MSWLAVNKDGTELISNVEPFKELEYGCYLCYESYGVGSHKYTCDESVLMPKGSIEKLIGRKLTWEDEPYKYE